MNDRFRKETSKKLLKIRNFQIHIAAIHYRIDGKNLTVTIENNITEHVQYTGE